MMQTMLEKLHYQEQKNLLIQGLPSSIEKQFSKVSFAKNLTPLLRSRKIEFALIFAVNQQQLGAILRDVVPALHDLGKLWVAYPRSSSKIVSDLNRECSWSCVAEMGYEHAEEAGLDHMWNAIRFEKSTLAEALPMDSAKGRTASETIELPIPKNGRSLGKVAGRV